VVDSAKNFIKIQWEKPKKDGGAPVTGYNVERKDPRTGTWNKINDEPVKVLSVIFVYILSHHITGALLTFDASFAKLLWSFVVL